MPTSPTSEALAAPEAASGRRTRLREFQAQLVERMQAAASGADTHVNQLGIEAGNTRWLVSLQHAGEIVAVGALAPVPLTQDWFLGLTNVRGKLVTVTDLARFNGGPRTELDKDSRILAFAPALGFNGGLLVSRVLGLRNMTRMKAAGYDTTQAAAQDTAQDQGEPAHGQASWNGGVLLDEEGQAWRQLDLAQLLRDPRYLQVGI